MAGHDVGAPSGFIIPFSFAYDPALLMVGAGVLHVVLRTAAATLGIVMLGAGLIAYLRARCVGGRRALLLGSAAFPIFPGALGDIVGAACFVVALLSQRAAPAPSPAR